VEENKFVDRRFDRLAWIALFLPIIAKLDVFRPDIAAIYTGFGEDTSGEITVGLRQTLEIVAIAISLAGALFLFTKIRWERPLPAVQKAAIGYLGAILFSTFVSISPFLTILRASETIAGCIILLHFINGRSNDEAIYWIVNILLSMCLLSVADKLTFLFMYSPPDVFEFIRNNGSGSAACAALVILATSGFKSRKAILYIGVALFCVIFFRSLTNILGALLGIAIAMTAKIFKQKNASDMGISWIILLGVAGYVVFIRYFLAEDAISLLAYFSGRSQAGIENLTGRSDIWRYAWDLASLNPQGLGYIAGERIELFALLRDLNGFGTHSHNIILSILIGSGWLGVVVFVIWLFLAIGKSDRSTNDIFGTYMALIIFFVISSLTDPSIGSIFGSSMIVFTYLSFSNVRTTRITA